MDGLHCLLLGVALYGWAMFVVTHCYFKKMGALHDSTLEKWQASNRRWSELVDDILREQRERASQQ